MKHKHAGIGFQSKGAGHAQKERGVRFHRAAHIGQDEQARGFDAFDFPRRLHQLAAPGNAAAQGLAQIEPLSARRHAPAPGRFGLQLGGDLARQLSQGAELLRHPHLAFARVQGVGAAGTALGSRRASALFVVAYRRHIPRCLRCSLFAAGLGGGLLGRIHLIVQVLHALAQVATGAGLAADFHAAAHFFGMPKALVHIGPQIPLAVAVASDCTPGRLDRFFFQRAQVQCRLQHGLLFGHTNGQTMVTQQGRKARQALRGRAGGWGDWVCTHVVALACSLLFSATPTLRRPSTSWRKRSGPITKRSSRVLSKQPKVPKTADMSSGKWLCCR